MQWYLLSNSHLLILNIFLRVLKLAKKSSLPAADDKKCSNCRWHFCCNFFPLNPKGMFLFLIFEAFQSGNRQVLNIFDRYFWQAANEPSTYHRRRWRWLHGKRYILSLKHRPMISWEILTFMSLGLRAPCCYDQLIHEAL